MDNHFHAVMQHDDLTNIMKSIKGFTAKEIIKTLKNDKKDWLLNQLGYYKLKHKTKSEYQVWQESFHPQQIISDKMLRQKVEYIHFNPVKRGYVTRPEYWKYSSAAYYATGEEGVIKLDKFG
jgi:REP element-mobilizing transposase RayT